MKKNCFGVMVAGFGLSLGACSGPSKFDLTHLPDKKDSGLNWSAGHNVTPGCKVQVSGTPGCDGGSVVDCGPGYSPPSRCEQLGATIGPGFTPPPGHLAFCCMH